MQHLATHAAGVSPVSDPGVSRWEAVTRPALAALYHSRASHLALISHVAAHGPHPLISRVMRMGCVALNVDSPTRH